MIGFRRRHLLIALGALLACLVLASVAAARAGLIRFSGRTNQGFPVRLSSDSHHVYLIRIKVKLRCRNGGLLYDDLSDFEAAHLRANGRFNDLQFGPSDEVHWRGAVRGRKVHGSVRVKDHLKNAVHCDSGNVAFTAHSVAR